MNKPMNDQQTTDIDTLTVGDRIRFTPQPGNRWWIIRARDQRYIVATQQRAFHASDELLYTVVDLESTVTRNGVKPGTARSSLNTLGGGYDIGDNGRNCGQILDDLTSGEWELSHRRIVQVESIEVQR